jgi:co-chaperonin GroES (HSP10)
MAAEPAFAKRSNKVTKAVASKLKGDSQKEKDELAKKIAPKLPVPKGYRILIMIPEIDDTHDGMILKASQTKHDEEVSSIVGFVLGMGPDAYKDEERFSEPYCKEGEFIIMREYSGSRLVIMGKEFRLINDDTVLATVDDPTGIMRKWK